MGTGGGDYGDGGTVVVTGGKLTAVGSTRSTTGQASAGIGAGRPRTTEGAQSSPGTFDYIGGIVIASAGTPSGSGAGSQAIGVNYAVVGTDPDLSCLNFAAELVMKAGADKGSAVRVSSGAYAQGCGRSYVVILESSFFDVDKSASINISDVTALLDLLSGSASAGLSCDLNVDGAVNISDVTELLEFLSVY